MHPFANAALGGALIGVAATLMLVGLGRVAGISGVVGSLFDRSLAPHGWRAAFVVGLLSIGAAAALLFPARLVTANGLGLPQAMAAAVLVGVGTQLGGGCTSGHGVCGLSRFSIRSLGATLVFMLCGMVTATLMGRLS